MRLLLPIICLISVVQADSEELISKSDFWIGSYLIPSPSISKLEKVLLPQPIRPKGTIVSTSASSGLRDFSDC